MAQMKEQMKAPGKNTTKQQRDSQPIRCTVLVIRKLTELVGFGHKLDEKMKTMLRVTGKCTGNQ